MVAGLLLVTRRSITWLVRRMRARVSRCHVCRVWLLVACAPLATCKQYLYRVYSKYVQTMYLRHAWWALWCSHCGLSHKKLLSRSELCVLKALKAQCTLPMRPDRPWALSSVVWRRTTPVHVGVKCSTVCGVTPQVNTLLGVTPKANIDFHVLTFEKKISS